jgi:hypothetical protein
MNKIIEASDRTPKICIDTTNSKISFTGVMIPENPIEHFAELNKELADLCKNMSDLTLEFDLEYFNTGSAKYLYEMIKKLAALINLSIVWIYEDDDEDIYETGKEYEKLTGLPFEFVAK